jgi:hypothetical protein
MKIPLGLAAVLHLAMLGGSASAFPAAAISQLGAPIEQVASCFSCRAKAQDKRP